MAWHGSGVRPLSEPKVIKVTDAYIQKASKRYSTQTHLLFCFVLLTWVNLPDSNICTAKLITSSSLLEIWLLIHAEIILCYLILIFGWIYRWNFIATNQSTNARCRISMQKIGLRLLCVLREVYTQIHRIFVWHTLKEDMVIPNPHSSTRGAVRHRLPVWNLS